MLYYRLLIHPSNQEKCIEEMSDHYIEFLFILLSEDISETEKEWKLQFNEWSTQYIVDWKIQYDNFLGESKCDGGGSWDKVFYLGIVSSVVSLQVV